MTEQNDNIWEYNSLEVNKDNEVVGSAYTSTFKGGYDVQVAVFSYEYEINGETKMNHVPNVTLTDESGSIVEEPYARDSENPEKAIENAINQGEYVFENPTEFI